MHYKTEELLKQAESADGNDTSINGAKKEFENEPAAADFFRHLKQKLFNLEAWNSHSGLSSYAHFDRNGNELAGEPLKEGDFIRIALKGSGKFDWVRVERIHQTPFEIVLTVKPSFDPTGTEKESTSHFFTSAATNNFCLLNDQTSVLFYVVGLNERTNTDETGNLFETVRNAATANLGYYLGIQKGEWKTFCNNFLEIETEK